MSWSPPIYVVLPDADVVQEMAAQLGIDTLPDGTPSTGNHNFALQAISPPWDTAPEVDEDGNVIVPGVPMPGLWFMGRLNTAWPGYDATMATLQAAGVLRDLVDPPVLWAGGE